MHKNFIRCFISYKYFENNYVFTRHDLGHILPIVLVDIFIFAYLLQYHYSVDILPEMCPSTLFKNVFPFCKL